MSWYIIGMQLMRTAIAAMLLGGCGSAAKVAPTGPDVEPTPTESSPAPPRDAALEARTAFENPGGMWLPRQLALPVHAEQLRAMGMALDPAALSDPLADPLGAVVELSGCTGSFVSRDGLIITNHHCAQGALELNATPAANLVENGFLAKDRADERSAGPTEHVYVAQAFRDVTREVVDGLAAITDPTARYAELEKRFKALVAACEQDRPGIKCRVTDYYRGAEYQLIETLELRDLRLVEAPHRAIGNYGGEIDNWAWPRHTGDWSFFRAYVGKDGKPADYSPDNVPYQPKHWLKIAKTPLAEHDVVMVVGYPGSTSRLDTYAETKFDLEFSYPFAIERYQASYELATELMKRGGATAIKAGVYKQGIQNGLENTQGTLAGLIKGDALAAKQRQAEALAVYLAQPGHEDDRLAVARLEEMSAAKRKTAKLDSLRGRAENGAALLRIAHELVRNAEERPKPDAARAPGYQDRDRADQLAEAKGFAADYDPVIDRAFWRLSLVRALQLPPAERPWLATIVGAKPGQVVDEPLIDRALDRLYQSKLTDEKLRVKLLTSATRKQLGANADPFLKLAVALAPELRAREVQDKRDAAELALLAPHLGAALRDSAGGALAPDANSTLRITYGTVRRFDGGGQPFTKASEILAKNTGTEPFDAPPALLEAIEAKAWGHWADPVLGEVPVDFISDLDTTGGNSGSPTLDARGELVGLLFDGNLESVASDVVWNHALTRSIHLDVRYLAWVLTHVDHADALAAELGLAP